MSGSCHLTDRNFFLRNLDSESWDFFQNFKNSAESRILTSCTVNPVSVDFELLNYSRSGLNRF